MRKVIRGLGVSVDDLISLENRVNNLINLASEEDVKNEKRKIWQTAYDTFNKAKNEVIKIVNEVQGYTKVTGWVTEARDVYGKLSTIYSLYFPSSSSIPSEKVPAQLQSMLASLQSAEAEAKAFLDKVKNKSGQDAEKIKQIKAALTALLPKIDAIANNPDYTEGLRTQAKDVAKLVREYVGVNTIAPLKPGAAGLGRLGLTEAETADRLLAAVNALLVAADDPGNTRTPGMTPPIQSPIKNPIKPPKAPVTPPAVDTPISKPAAPPATSKPKPYVPPPLVKPVSVEPTRPVAPRPAEEPRSPAPAAPVKENPLMGLAGVGIASYIIWKMFSGNKR